MSFQSRSMSSQNQCCFVTHTEEKISSFLLFITNVQKLDVPGPDEKFCLCWLCACTKFSSGGAIFPVHLIFEHL